MPTTPSPHLRPVRADDGCSATGAPTTAPVAPISKTVTIIAAAGIVTVQALEGTYRRHRGSTWSFDSADGRHHVDVVTAVPTLVWLQAEAAIVLSHIAHQRHLYLVASSS